MMTKALLEWETIDADQINEIMAGREPTPPKSVQLTKRTPPGDTGSGGVATNAPAPA
jgi:cell division protease FtsH